MNALRVLCVDDNEDLLRALVVFLGLVPGVEVVGALPCATHLEETVRETHPDIMVLDLDMPGQHPLEALRRLNDAGETMRTVIFSGHVRSELIADAMDAGAWGYVSKHDGEAELLAAIRCVTDGEIAWSPEIRSAIARR